MWSPNSYADPGIYVSDTSTYGRIIQASVEHHVRTEFAFNRAANWELFTPQTEEEAGEGLTTVGMDTVMDPRRNGGRMNEATTDEIVQVVEDSPAAKAGLRQEDLILDIDETPVEQPGDLQRLMISDRIGRAVCVRLFRNGDIVDVTVHPIELEH